MEGCFQLSFSIIFPLLLPSPVHFWSFLSVFLSCFIYRICSHVSFLIAPLGYLISIKYLCRYSRNTKENCLLHFVWSQPQSHCNPRYIIHLWLCLFCNPVQSSFVPAFLCNLWPFSLTWSLYTRCLWFVNCIIQCPTFVSPAVTHQSQVLVLYFCLSALHPSGIYMHICMIHLPLLSLVFLAAHPLLQYCCHLLLLL